MSMHDPIADMLTRVRNAQQMRHLEVAMPSSKMKEQIAQVLKKEGYILDYALNAESNNTKTLTIQLKYFKDRPVIARITRISRPGLRIYKSYKKLSPVSGFGIAILSTSRGIMSHLLAKAQGVGGEVICEVA
ncbi:MAG: 30S ribosomal protein S8 [Legionellaceae bacterium]|nr:30S ribosomal protein S8 [Legionellaceae bacterium]